MVYCHIGIRFAAFPFEYYEIQLSAFFFSSDDSTSLHSPTPARVSIEKPWDIPSKRAFNDDAIFHMMTFFCKAFVNAQWKLNNFQMDWKQCGCCFFSTLILCFLFLFRQVKAESVFFDWCFSLVRRFWWANSFKSRFMHTCT